MVSKLKEFIKNGVTQLDGIVPLNVIKSAHKEFHADYLQSAEIYEEKIKQDLDRSVIGLGDKRYMLTVELSGAFAEPDLYANPAILEILEEALGKDFVIDSYGIVLSLPGSKDQRLHHDGGLFGNQIDRILPVYAITVVIPLIEMNTETGSTKVWPGTHRSVIRDAENQDLSNLTGHIMPLVKEGSSIIWDYRTMHLGRENTSHTPRPILYITYCKPWFRDTGNFHHKRRALLGPGFLDTVPKQSRFLFRFSD